MLEVLASSVSEPAKSKAEQQSGSTASFAGAGQKENGGKTVLPRVLVEHEEVQTSIFFTTRHARS